MNGSPFEQVRSIRNALGTVWDVVFAPFGKLTEIQLEAIPPVLSGEHAVLTSPTASGKTEAALAPLARRFIDSGRKAGPWLLYVVPTRALVADLERRMRPVLAELGIESAYRTSDSPHLPRTFPHFLFTTPESLDSLICRKKAIWANVRAVVLDELHLLDGSYRGDQVRVLLRRLSAGLWSSKPQMIIMSATVPNPEDMARRYFDAGVVAIPSDGRGDELGHSFTVVGSGEPRGLDFKVMRTVGEALAACKASRRFKVLLFCNSRRDCEHVADDIVRKRQWPAAGVFVHHGSLSRAVRKESEAGFQEARAAVCVATTTLELGIDIGDVSAAVLFGPPPSPSAFVQRIGRACRREKSVYAIGVALTDEDASRFVALATLARQSIIEPGSYVPDYSVAVQQMFSMLYANPTGVPPELIQDMVSPICPPDAFSDILSQLTAQGHVERSGRLLRASQEIMDHGDRGDIHANIPEERSIEVVDTTTGKRLGVVSAHGAQQGSVILAGQVWNITGEEGRNKVAARPGAGEPEGRRFSAHPEFGRYFSYLPPHLRDRMRAERDVT